jgi:photosystem II stability/assembly factor-like uncharacterized protein
LKSLDGGITWDTTGLKFPVNNLILLNSLIINTLDTSSLTVGTSQGVFRSFDAGATWVQQLTGDFKQVLYHPTDTNIIYAARNGYNQADIFRTADGGYNWQQVTNFGNSLRVTMAVTPANPNIVKLVVANVDAGLEGVYHSGDAGESFSKIFGDPTDCTTNILSGNQTPSSSDCSGQGWYDLSIAISPTDENDVVVGGTNTWRSVNGGAFFDLANQWTGGFPGVQIVHADKHWHAYNPLNPGVLYECNDGGIYKTSNPQSQLWTDLTNGLNITQFYRLAVSNVAVNAIAGAQDNGTKAIAFTGGSDELTGGDGMDCQMDYSDPDVYYTSSQYGSFNRTTNGGINFDYITDNIGINIAGEWITPLIIHPTDPFSILAGFDHVYHSTDRGDSWTDISPTLNANLRAQRLTMSPANTDRIWGLWNDNTIKYTSDFGNTWLLLSHSLSTITDIMADPKDGDVLWVSIGGYGNQKVYRYKVGGGWTNQGTGLPKVPANCFMKDSSNATLYVGTDIGVYYKDTSMSSWAPYDEGLPTAEVTDLAINYATNELWAATYGRGLWKSPRQRDTSVTTSVAGGFSAGPYAPQVIVVLPNPNKGAFAIKCTDLDLRGRNVDLVVTGIDGRIVQQRSGLLDGQGGIAVDISGAAKGVYAVEVFSRGRKCGQASFVVE